jgi:hypothetical protein
VKFLCICHYGHSRSAALVRVLHGRRHEAVCAGAGTSPSVLPALVQWADVVVNMVPNEIHLDTPKQVIIDIGRDQWSNPYNQELLKLLEAKVIEHGW